ncbi:anti-FecI sigma factor, FecR [Hyphomicrobium sulfonivorans]|uniref:Anti-FecI sigma factor, FecR n=1 Tax=Hyphomicrobium sulfonivorans TaxID=121290 RepID=A0A109BBY5_HYPSL|nr:FecR family protein [Hyphomicrobium sulfonivorans]KWT65797.1 anti-FecI sigma factor, FecR [Hyphomicrobium sulfonivorans]
MAPTDDAQAQRKRREKAIDLHLRTQDPDQATAAHKALEAWVARSPQNAEAYEEVRALIGEARSAILTDPKLTALKPKKRSSARTKTAALAMLIGTATVAFYTLDGPIRMQADLMSGTGEMPIVALADGSTMQLNANSAVSFEFGEHERIVHLLRGEAYFEVAKDAKRPFTVETINTRARALGTAFNVRLAADTRVIVTEHAVDVASLMSETPKVRVSAGEEVVCCTNGRAGKIRTVDPAVALAWRRGQLVVDNVTLQAVIDEIRRYFSGSIIIASDELAQRRVSGTFNIADPDKALNLIGASLGITITRLGPVVIVRG